MRIGTLQFAPRLGKVEYNIRRADELLSTAMKKIGGDDTRPLDLLVLPEMAFSGYNFSSLGTIKPYLEPTEAGPTAEWARSTARRLGCVVCVGYPEIQRNPEGAVSPHSHTPMTPREDDEIDADGNGEATARDDSGESRFNSLLIVDPAGSTLQNYQKRFLYYTDETWADEGENGKGDFALPIPLSSTNSPPSRSGDTSTTTIPTTVGICMDINPYRFIAPYTAYEFARHAISSGAKLIVLSMAWLTLLEPEELSELSSRPDMDTFQYWIKRFWPFVSGDDWDGGEIVIVFANRCGEEEGLEGKDVARYAGTSCVLAIRRPKGTKMTSVVNPELQDLSDTEVAVWDMLGRGEEGMCFADTDSEPKLVFRIKEAGEP